MNYKFLECTEPQPQVRRIYLNRPEKRNALCNPLRKELFDCLEAFDEDHISIELGHSSSKFEQPMKHNI